MAYAIIRTGGKQYRAESGKTIRIPSLPGDAGSKVTFSDVILGSGMDGGELALAARRRRPDLPTLLTSGYEKPLVHSETKSLPLLRKPYRREELAAAVRLAMDGSAA